MNPRQLVAEALVLMSAVETMEAGTERVSLDWARSNWGELDGLALLRAALTGPFAGQIAMVSSFGAESAVLLDMIASVDRRTPVVFLETGKLFPETLAYKDELVDWLGLERRALDPARSGRAREIRSGRRCCGAVSPTCAATSARPSRWTRRWPDSPAGSPAASGSRAACAPRCRPSRSTAPPAAQAQPVGQLVAGRYPALSAAAPAAAAPVCWRAAIPSIGCVPCTRPVKAGEDVAAGRWWRLDKTECGIHRGEGI